jgi:hypothetical protein
MRKKSLLLLLLLLIAISGIYFFYTRIWNPSPRDIAIEKAIEISADSLFLSYTTDEKKANALFLDKAIQVSGVVADLKKNEEGKTTIFLQTSDPMFGVNCTMEGDVASIKKGDTVTIKGICTGYLTDVILIRGYLVK